MNMENANGALGADIMAQLQAQLESMQPYSGSDEGGMVGLGNETIDDGVYEQIMMFELDDEVYGLDILRVQEIRSFNAMTMIPNSPVYVVGMMNLRGAIVPVIDLRIRFRLADKETTDTTVIIVLRAFPKDGDQEKTVGIVVDSVRDAKNIHEDAMQVVPADHNSRLGEGAVRSLASVDDHMVTILDIDRIFTGEFSR